MSPPQFISDERGELSIKTESFVFPQSCLLSFPSYNLEYLSHFFSRTIPNSEFRHHSEKHSLAPPPVHIPLMEYKRISPHPVHCHTDNCSLVSFTCCCVCVLSRVRLFVTTRTTARQSPLSMEFSRQEYRHGLPCPSPGDLSDLRIKPTCLLHLLHWQMDSFTTSTSLLKPVSLLCETKVPTVFFIVFLIQWHTVSNQ